MSWRRSRWSLIAFLAGMSLVALAYGQGGPPLLTDDPGTPGNGKWEINTALTVERSRHEWVWEAPLLDINYGLGDHMQLKYEVPFLILDRDEEGPIGGLGNSLAGVKYRFLDQDKAGIGLSIYPQLEFNNPTHSVHRGLVESGTNFLLPIQAAKQFGAFGVNVEVGYEFIQHEKDQWIHGVALGYAVNKRFELLGEVFGTVDDDFRHEQLILNLGSRWELSEHVKLLFSVGRGIVTQEDTPTLLMYTGLQFTF